MAKAWRFNDSQMEEWARKCQWLSLSMAFKDALMDGADTEFLKKLQQVVKREGVVRSSDIEDWRIFFVETVPLLREEVEHHLTTAEAFLPPGPARTTSKATDWAKAEAAQRVENSRRGMKSRRKK